MENTYFLTPMKRSHLVLANGPGSLVRTRSKITALVCDLHTWEQSIPVSAAEGVDKDSERRLVLNRYKIRDSVLEAATGVNFLVSPPTYDDGPRAGKQWVLPLVRFPLSEVCTNLRCGQLSLSDPSRATVSSGQWGCQTCASKSAGDPGKRRNYRKKQVTVMMACPYGHLDEVDFSGLVHGGAIECANPDIRVSMSESLKRPKIRCESCGANRVPDKVEHRCTGARPWVIGHRAGNEDCPGQMRIVESTSVQVYFASTKSSIFIPEPGVSEKLIEWIRLNVDEAIFSRDSSKQCEEYMRRAAAAGHQNVTKERFLDHVDRAFPPQVLDDDSQWDEVAVRDNEFHHLAEGVPNHVSDLLEFRQVGDFGGSEWIGVSRPVERVVAVDRLAETRMLDGFSRWKPEDPGPIEGIRRLWGGPFTKTSERWLPGYRVTGEGMLFILDPGLVTAWANGNTALPLEDGLFYDRKIGRLSVAGRLAHSFGHGVMKVLADRSGYPLAGIRDRIYDLEDRRVAVLVYTADGDRMGTLGGLVEHADGRRLSELVADAIDGLRWCAQDPVCTSAAVGDELRSPGACHHCLLLPETSCEAFNEGLDRALLVGSASRGIRGFFHVG